MFLHFLYPLSEYFSPLNVLRYITLRGLYSIITAFIIGVIITPFFIRWMSSRKLGQALRDDGPSKHLLTKQGISTMGGVVIILSTLISVLLWGNLKNSLVWGGVVVLILLGILGLLDDLLKLKYKNSRGVRGKTKLIVQFIVGLLIGLFLVKEGNIGTVLQLPFFKHMTYDLGIFFVLFAALVIVASSNAVNLTDGLDGLVSVPLIISFITYMCLVYCAGNELIATYLQVIHVKGAAEVCILIGAIVGALVAFLWYNAYPALIFMGDVGALSLGGALGYVVLVAKQEILLVIVGGVFVLEALSVIIQVLSFKTRKKRIFKMAPLHHHFELSGWPEPRVIVRFWIISGIFALIALSTLKLR